MRPMTLRRFSVFLLTFATAASLAWCRRADGQDDKDDVASVKFSIVATAQNNGNYEKAAGEWEAFIKKYPDYKRIDEAHYYLGICQLHVKKHDEAIKTFAEVLQKFPQFKSADGVRYNMGLARHQLAQASGKADDFKAAANQFGDMIAKHADSPLASRAMYLQAEALYGAGDAEGSVKSFQQLLAKFPDSSLAANAYYYLGVTQQEDLKQFDQAAKTYDDFLKKPAYTQHELAGEIRLRHGICLYELKDFAKAEQRFAEVAQNKEGALADFALLRQAQCRLEQKKPEEAAQLFARLLSDFPESTYRAAAQLAAGKCYFETEKFDDAQKSLAAVASIDGARPEEKSEAAYWLARTLMKQDKPADALNIVSAALSQNPGEQWQPYLLIAKADALYDIADRRSESTAAYNEFLQKFPQHELAAQAQYMSALTALGEKELAEASRKAEAFLASGELKEHALRPAVLFIAAESQVRGGGIGDAAKRQKAETYYRQLLAEHPEHQDAPRAALGIGWCLLEGEKLDEAVKFVSGHLGDLKSPEMKAEANLMIGRAHARLTQHAEALAAFDQAQQDAPNWPRGDHVLFESAQSHAAMENADQARQRLEQLLAKYVDSDLRPQAIFQLGEFAHAAGKHDEAIARFSEVTQKYGESDVGPAARFGLAAAQFAKGDNETALASLNELVAATSDDMLRSRGLYLRGLVRQKLNQFDGAAQDLTAFLSSNPPEPDTLDARYALAMCQIGQKKPADAEKTLADLLTAKPDYRLADQVRYELGHALLAQDKDAQAAAAFKELAEKFPETPFAAEAWFHVGRRHEDLAGGLDDAAAKQQEYAAAAAALAAGLKTAKAPQLREKLRYKLGDMQFRQDQFAAAAKTLAEQLQESPEGELAGAARYLAGESLFRKDKFQEALPLFEKVAQDKVEKYLAEALYRAGACGGSLKNWPVSQKHYDQFIKQFPKHERVADARYGLAFALHNQNQFEAAEKLYEQVTEETITEAAAKARFMLGEIAFARKKFDDANFHYGGVIGGYNYPHWKGMARLEMARCYREQQQKSKAIAELETLLKEDPDHERASDAQKLLAELRK